MSGVFMILKLFRTSILSAFFCVAGLFVTKPDAATIYDFEYSTQDWTAQAIAGGPWWTTEWSASGNSSLKADVWLYDQAKYVLKLTKNQDFSGKKYLKAKVRRSTWGNWSGFTAKIYIKTGSNWQWFDGGLVNVTDAGQELSIDISKTVGYNNVREIGVAFQTWGNCWNKAAIYVDNVRLESEETGPEHLAWTKEGKLAIDNDENVFVAGLAVSKVNPANGDALWTKQISEASSALSTIIYNNNLYVSNSNGTYQIDKTDGHIIWVNSISAVKMYSNSPDGHLLVMAKVTAGEYKVYSLNPETGTIQWQSQSYIITPDYPPTINYIDNNVAVVTVYNNSNSEIYRRGYVYNIANGTELWNTGDAFILTADASGLYKSATATNPMTKCNLLTGATIWTLNSTVKVNTLFAKGNYLYASGYSPLQGYRFLSINPQTGSIIWNINGGPRDEDQKILDDGSFSSRLGREGGPATASIFDKVDGHSRTFPAVGPNVIFNSLGDIFYTRSFYNQETSTYVNDAKLANLSTLADYWTFQFPNNENVSPVIPYYYMTYFGSDNQTIFVYAYDYDNNGTLCALNRADGTTRWSQNLSDLAQHSTMGSQEEKVKMTSTHFYYNQMGAFGDEYPDKVFCFVK
jgi:hypothetical protein